jgi:phosphoribosylpyrophosphate synthetase
LVLKDYVDGGANVLITIDPHSEKAAQEASSLRLDFRSINPFQSGRDINPYKLGLGGEKAKEIIQKLRPFQERFAGMKGENSQHLYCVSVDSGTERRTENFVERAHPELSPEKLYAHIVYLSKSRFSYEDVRSSFKQFSQINGENIDKEGTYIIIDDMFASSETAAKVAKMLKTCGAHRVEVWTSHAVTMPQQYTKANDRTYIDQVVCLDTVPQHPDLKVEYICSSADFLAAELYKVHQKLVASR